MIELDIKKEFSCDVLVLGGGCAGIAAGICASRHGANTIIAELNGFLGGMATAGLVAPFMTSYDSYGETQLIRGFFDEFVRRMEKEGGAIHPSKMECGTSRTAYRVDGHKNCSAFNSEVYKKVAEDMCIESGVKLLYHLMFVKAECEDGNVKAAYFATKDGIYKITAKIFIDCSGDADLAAACGVPIVFGDGEGEVQASSLFFTVKGVDKEAMDKHMFEAQDIETKFYMKEILKERESGNFPLYRAKIMLFEGLNDEWTVNMSQMDDVNTVDPEAITNAEIVGRQQVDYIIRFLKKYAAGCQNISLVKSASNLGVRESRRIVGAYEMTREDAVNSAKFEDSVFCCSNSMDIHKKGWVEYVVRKSDRPYYFPYRSLVASELDNLLVAGRCASAERAVMAAVRVMPTCFAMGQAAGTAAAIAVNEDIRTIDVNSKKLVDMLLADGVVLL